MWILSWVRTLRIAGCRKVWERTWAWSSHNYEEMLASLEPKARMHPRGSLGGYGTIGGTPGHHLSVLLRSLCVHFTLLPPCRLTSVGTENECRNWGQIPMTVIASNQQPLMKIVHPLIHNVGSRSRRQVAFGAIIARANTLGWATLPLTSNTGPTQETQTQEGDLSLARDIGDSPVQKHLLPHCSKYYPSALAKRLKIMSLTLESVNPDCNLGSCGSSPASVICYQSLEKSVWPYNV